MLFFRPAAASSGGSLGLGPGPGWLTWPAGGRLRHHHWHLWRQDLFTLRSSHLEPGCSTGSAGLLPLAWRPIKLGLMLAAAWSFMFQQNFLGLRCARRIGALAIA